MSGSISLLKVLFISVLVLLGVSHAGSVFAGTNVWTSNGPEGGGIHALAIDPKKPTTLYAGTFGQGMFKSTNGGNSWYPINTNLLTDTDKIIRSLAIDPKTPTTLYIGTAHYVAFKSTDGGETWNAITGLPHTTAEPLVIDPQTPSIVYAGTGMSRHDLLKSTDGGMSWRSIPVEICCINSLVIDPDTPTILYAGWGYTMEKPSESGVEIISEGGVIKSTDGGETWRQADCGLPIIEVRALAIDPRTPSILYAGTYGGVFKSTDGCDTWNEVNTGMGKGSVTALAIDPLTPRIIYSGTPYDGVFRSTNGGLGWSSFNEGLTHRNVHALVINPLRPAVVYAGTEGGGVFGIEQTPHQLHQIYLPLVSFPANFNTVLTWAFWGSPEEAVSHKLVADVFMKEHPEIKIETWNEPWDNYFTKIQALWASGDPKRVPDIAFLWPTPKYAAQGVLENLDPYIKQSGYNLDDYWPGLLESAKYQGSVYGLPRDIEANVLYYNKDLFDKAGVKYPDETWTWDNLLAAAEKLTVKDANGKVTQYALAMAGYKYSKWVHQNGSAILDDYVNPSKCLLSTPDSIAAIKFFADMMNNGYAMRDTDLSQAGGDDWVFWSGQVAMIIQNTSRVSSLNAAKMNYDVAVVPIPKGGKRWNEAAGAAWVMSAASDNKDAAWTFLQWLQGKDGGEKLYTERGEIFPALQSVANSPAFMTEQPPANKQGIITEAAASGVGGFGYFPEWDELDSSVISPALQKIWAGKSDPARALIELCRRADQFLKDKGYPK